MFEPFCCRYLQHMDVSVVIPLFNEVESLPELLQRLNSVLDGGYEYELILVDDGSNDGSWGVVEQAAASDNRIKGVRFRRNYGKSAALNEGFRAASGDVVITMDADLQDDPDELPALIAMIRDEGYDLVSGWKKKRHDPITKTIPTKLYNWTLRKVSGLDLHDSNCGLKAYSGDVTRSIEVYGEMHRYIPFIAKKNGFGRIGEKVVTHHARKYGKTKFGVDRFINGFLDLLSITFIYRFGKKPMHFFGFMGSLMFVLGFGSTLWLVGHKLYMLNVGQPAPLVSDQALFYIALTSMIMGVQLFTAGFVADLVSRSSADRNVYKIKSKIGL
jgi:glycosyltransferase involved in cell wall biosynthesis